MSWSSFLPFAFGFVKGFVEEVTRPEPADRTSSPHADDFPSRMIAFGQATGMGMPIFRRGSAGFLVPVRGVEYLVVLTARHDLVMASAPSKVTFPRSIPAELLRLIDRLNAEATNGCYFEADEDESGASISCTTKLGLHQLTQSVFEAVLTELACRAAALDKSLVQNGYAR